MKKVKKLKKGDTIAVLSPSAGVPNIFPKVFDNGLTNLENMGFKIKEFPTTRKSPEYLHENPKKRAQDINNAFKDKEVDGIIASIGGDDSVRILKYLNKNIIKKNPKFLMGLSDNTTLTTFVNQLGITTFYGPSIMVGISQLNYIPNYKKNFEEFIFGKWKNYTYPQYPTYSNGYLDWRGELQGVKKLEPTTGWEFPKGGKNASGELFGGCIEVLNFINGTDFWPNKNFWKNKILFIETSEEKPSPDYVKYTLRNFGVQGILDKIQGVLVGRARDYSNEEKKQLNENINLVIKKEFGKEFPVVTNMDFGHTDPQIILPLGTKTLIDVKNKKLKLLESPFAK